MITMKIHLTSLILFLLLFYSSLTFSQHEIKIKFKNLKESECYLGFHYGNNKYIKDTALINSKGIATFQGKEPLPGGIYLIILPSRNYFEIIVTEAKIHIETDTNEFVDNMKIIASDENMAFYDYMQFMKSQHLVRMEYQKSLERNKDNNDSTEIIKNKIAEIDKGVIDFRKNMIESKPNLFWSKVLSMMDEPRPREKEENEPDSIYSRFLYNWYQIHFFDNVDFSDNRILRTPIYEGKIMKFMDRVTIHHPDSIKYAASRVIDKTLADTELFKFTLIKLFNKYAQSKYMGMDAVFVHLAERYYLSGLAYWADSTQLAKIWERVYKLSANLIGMQARNLIMSDSSGIPRSLHKINSEYTVLIFWDPECGHCKKELPKLKKLYNKTDRDSLEVFSVYVGSDIKAWKKYIKDNNYSWINVSDPNNESNFRILYDIHSTPVVYLLNNNKIIEAKRIAVDDIEKIINSIERKDFSKDSNKTNEQKDDKG